MSVLCIALQHCDAHRPPLIEFLIRKCYLVYEEKDEAFSFNPSSIHGR